MRKWSLILLLLIAHGVWPGTSEGETPNQITVDETEIDAVLSALTGLHVGGQWFLTYFHGKTGDQYFSRFVVERGYINIEKVFSSTFSGRITPDISVDREGDGEGDLEMRLKYCFVRYQLPPSGPLQQAAIEFGLIPRPWLGYDEKINSYRMQGAMFLERSNLLNSADFGATFTTLLGGKLSAEDQPYAGAPQLGRYGTLAIGIFNGGGYHAIERNENKTIEGRLSLRPLPDKLPGFQFAYGTMIGKGNTIDSPEWLTQIALGAWQSRFLTLTAQQFWGKGDYKGAFVDLAGKSLENKGWSIFAEVRASQRWSIIGRRDTFRLETLPQVEDADRWIGGVCYRFSKFCRTLISYEREELTLHEKDENIKFCLETKF